MLFAAISGSLRAFLSARIGLIASEIVGVLTVLGRIIKLSPTTMGLTLLALGNSIDNVFSTLGLVSNGQATVAITGIYAADAFTMLCVCGSILLLLSLKQKKAVPIAFTPTAHVLLLTIQARKEEEELVGVRYLRKF